MSVSVYVKPEQMWEFFQKNEERLLHEMVLVAEDDDTGGSVYLSKEDDEPVLTVWIGGDSPEYEEIIVDEEDCEETTRWLYSKYLGAKNECKRPSVTKVEERMIERREKELLSALGDFLMTVTQDTGCADGSEFLDTYGVSDVSDILDDFLSILAYNYDYQVYRPTLLPEGPAGDEVLVEYPYNEQAAFEPIG